jgi:drug/metabolite transporter (DMT)-like permease
MGWQGGAGLALGSAFVTNLGFLWRHRGAVAAPDVDVRRPIHSAICLFRSKWWAIGYAAALVAWLLHIGSLALAPLSIVQAALAGGFVFLAVLADRFFGFELGRREWAGVLLAAAGMAFLALTAGEVNGKQSEYGMPAIVGFEIGMVAVGAFLIAGPARQVSSESRAGVLLGAGAGVLFTVTHVATKALTGEVDGPLSLASPWTAIIVVGGVVAFFASARSLQIGRAVPVIAATAIAGNATSIAAGVAVFGDPIGSSPLLATLRIAAFGLIVVAAAMIPGPMRAADASRETERRESRRTAAPGAQPAATA